MAKVEAFSLDDGANAELQYLIVGGNELNKFQINSRSGTRIKINLKKNFLKPKNLYTKRF